MSDVICKTKDSPRWSLRKIPLRKGEASQAYMYMTTTFMDIYKQSLTYLLTCVETNHGISMLSEVQCATLLSEHDHFTDSRSPGALLFIRSQPYRSCTQRWPKVTCHSAQTSHRCHPSTANELLKTCAEVRNLPPSPYAIFLNKSGSVEWAGTTPSMPQTSCFGKQELSEQLLPELVEGRWQGFTTSCNPWLNVSRIGHMTCQPQLHISTWRMTVPLSQEQNHINYEKLILLI